MPANSDLGARFSLEPPEAIIAGLTLAMHWQFDAIPALATTASAFNCVLVANPEPVNLEPLKRFFDG
jgi:hypothetical protein